MNSCEITVHAQAGKKKKKRAENVEKVVKFLACIVKNSFARWRQLYTRVPLPLPLAHIGWYHGSTHTDTNFFFEVGRRSNLLPLTPLSAILPPLLLLCFFFTATAAAVLLFLRRPAVSTGSSSSPLHLLLRRSCCWCFFFFSTSSSSSFVQYGFDDSYIYNIYFLYTDLMIFFFFLVFWYNGYNDSYIFDEFGI